MMSSQLSHLLLLRVFVAPVRQESLFSLVNCEVFTM
jgi:hypothetical protein